MSTVRDDSDAGTGLAGVAPPPGSLAGRVVGRVRAGRVAGRVRAGLGGGPALIRRHRLFSLALLLALVPRVIAMIGYQPAILFKLDSYDYLWGATHLRPNPANPSGYSLFLWLLWPFHSLALVAALQHVLGLSAAVMVYGVLRRWGVRQWIATAAALPVLFAPAQMMLEQLVMADLLALVLMVAAFAVLLTRDPPSLRRVVVAGLLMGASVPVRPTSLPLIVVMALYVAVRRWGWRRLAAVLAAGALPVLGYMGWFAGSHGSFNMTNSDGLFLWSRTMSFANCTIIKPPTGLRALCPDSQPGVSHPRLASQRELPKKYLWDHQAWQWQSAVPSLVPDTAAFTVANNSRAMRFAIRAIEAQPLGYAGAVSHDVVKAFRGRDTFLFPVGQPSAQGQDPVNYRYELAAVRSYTGTTAGIGPYLSSHLGTRLHEPAARLIRGYQRLISLPGPLFALILAVGLAGLAIGRRRSAEAAVLWVSAVIAVVLPIAEHEYTYRYVIPAIPLACMAAALAFRESRQDTPQPAVAADAQAPAGS